MLPILVLLSLSLVACASTSKRIPRWEGKVFIIHEGQIVRKQSGQVIPIGEAENALVFLEGDADSFIETYIGGCREWDPALPMTDLNEVLPK